MYKLIKKDLKIGWPFLFGILILISFIMHMLIWTMMDHFGGVIIPVTTLIVSVFCIASSFLFIIIDDTYKTSVIFASLPIRRSRIVCARYATCMLMTAYAFAIAIASCFSMIHIFGEYDPAFMILLSPAVMVGMLSFLFIVLSLFLPFIFTFGVSKGSAIALGTFLSMQVLASIATFVLKAFKGLIVIDVSLFVKCFNSCVNWIISLETSTTCVLLGSVVLAIIIFSLGLSICFYKKLDL
jgi:hypothetical protein